MPKPRFVPSAAVLARWKEEGLTVQEMADRIKEQDHIEVSIGTVYLALSLAGLNAQALYEGFVPWIVRPEHVNLLPIIMLRLAGRRAEGRPIPPDREAGLERWIARLEKQDVVVAYVEDSAEGFHYVPRRHGVDTGLIRVPDL